MLYGDVEMTIHAATATDGADGHKKMCCFEASKCSRIVWPIQISSGKND